MEPVLAIGGNQFLPGAAARDEQDETSLTTRRARVLLLGKGKSCMQGNVHVSARQQWDY